MKEHQNLTWNDIKEMSAETDRLIKEIAQLIKESNQRFDKLNAETNQKFDRIERKMHYKSLEGEIECDIFLFNGKSAAIIEVKYNAKPDNISIDRLISRVEVFKTLYPAYKNHNIYLGVAAMSFNQKLVWRLHRAGIATIRPIGKRMVVYDKNIKAF
ncbi:MAG: hypothetical protein FWC34_08210 [Bacteroidetes bacterium]|nr:hypothetical protein [Bacteroidota bacterium]MCL2302387.1 hypothetical protein [Lentimicrobiaceae bacterium]